MRIALIALAAAVCAEPALGESAADKQAAITAAFETSLRENTVFLHCTVTDAKIHKVVVKTWQEMISESVASMTRANVDAAFIARLKERAAYEKMMRLDAPYREIVAMCQGDWSQRFQTARFVPLDRRVAEILGR